MDWRHIYFDHDYLSAILQKQQEYGETEKMLRKLDCRFQTPFPAKMKVVYEDGQCLYQTAEEATTGMNSRGIQIEVVTPKESLMEQIDRTAWKIIRAREKGEERKEATILLKTGNAHCRRTIRSTYK